MTSGLSSAPIPVEVTEAVIDYLSDDPKALATCSLVCSAWISRTRHLLFGTVHLNPWRSRTFVDLISHTSSTIPSHIHQLDIDCSHSDEAEMDRFLSVFKSINDVDRISGIQCLRLRNLDWTVFPLALQSRIVSSLCLLFSRVSCLQLSEVVMHGMRQLYNVLGAFPGLERLEAGVKFLKYVEYDVASLSSKDSRLPVSLKEITLSNGGISTILGSIGSPRLSQPMRVRSLSLKGCTPEMFPYVSCALNALSATLETLQISFLQDNCMFDPHNALELSSLSNQVVLRTLHFGDIDLTTSNPSQFTVLPSILRVLESVTCLAISLSFRIRCLTDLEPFDWVSLCTLLSSQKQAGSEKRVQITLNLESDPDTTCTVATVEKWVDENLRVHLESDDIIKVNPREEITIVVDAGSWKVEIGQKS